MPASPQVWRAPEDVPADLRCSVVSIGVFDGVHRGHQAVVGRASEQAHRRGCPLVVVTFDPHPMTVVRPDRAPLAVATLEHRIRRLAEAGADAVFVLRFDQERSQQSAEDFVRELLVGTLHISAVVVGEDFRFGHRATGDVALLQALGEECGFEVHPVEPVSDPGRHRWSSTFVRDRVADGDVEEAERALGAPFRVEGVVVKGDQRGRAMGYPTANVPPTPGFVVPADGVYAGWLVRLDDPEATRMPAAISVGTNPTFDGVARRVEAYVLDRDDLELYGVPVAIEFAARLRGMVRFDSVDELLVQMADDVRRARVIVG